MWFLTVAGTSINGYFLARFSVFRMGFDEKGRVFEINSLRWIQANWNIDIGTLQQIVLEGDYPPSQAGDFSTCRRLVHSLLCDHVFC